MAAPAPTTSSPSPSAVSGVASPTEGQLTFWNASLVEHNSNLLQTMLLHDDPDEAADMNVGEVNEIMTLCDIQPEWTICEWAAGMGRLTLELAARVPKGKVYASDFVESFCQTNRERVKEAGVKNVQVDCIDASTYAPTATGSPPHAFDCIDLHFINWLLLYLDDSHAEKFLTAAIASLRTRIHGRAGKGAGSAAESHDQSGWIFLHESCWERANESEIFNALPKEEQQRLLAQPNVMYEECQTYYRTVYWYDHLIQKLGLEIVHCFELATYKPKKTFSADGQVEKEIAPEAAVEKKESGTVDEENSFYNRQMVWLLRLKKNAEPIKKADDSHDAMAGCVNCTHELKGEGCAACSTPLPVVTPEVTQQLVKLAQDGCTYQAKLYGVYALPRPPGSPAPKPGEPFLAAIRVDPITINFIHYPGAPFGAFFWSKNDDNREQRQKWQAEGNYVALHNDHMERGNPFPLDKCSHFLLGFQSECFTNNPRKDEINEHASLTLSSTVCNTRLDIEFESPAARNHFAHLFITVEKLCHLEERGVEIGLKYW